MRNNSYPGITFPRRRRSYGSPQQAAMTFSHCSKDLLRPIPDTVRILALCFSRCSGGKAGGQIRPNTCEKTIDTMHKTNFVHLLTFADTTRRVSLFYIGVR